MISIVLRKVLVRDDEWFRHPVDAAAFCNVCCRLKRLDEIAEQTVNGIPYEWAVPQPMFQGER